MKERNVCSQVKKIICVALKTSNPSASRGPIHVRKDPHAWYSLKLSTCGVTFDYRLPFISNLGYTCPHIYNLKFFMKKGHKSNTSRLIFTWHYCAFHKHANSQLPFSLPATIITITSNELWNTKTRKTDRNQPITYHKPWPFDPVLVKFLFPEMSAKMTDGSEKRKR